MPNILIIDDELSIRESFALILEDDHKVTLAASGEAGLKVLADQEIDLVFLDVRMTGLNGIETLKKIKEIDSTLEVIMVTAVNDVQKASEAIRYGAREYVVKPFEVSQIQELTQKILAKKKIINQETKVQTSLLANEYQLIGQSDKIKEIQKTIQGLKGKERILITGEPGTEKALLATIIHYQSKRREQSFKIIDLSAGLSLLDIKTLFNFSSTKAYTGTIFINNLERLPNEILQELIQIKPEPQLIGGCGEDVSTLNKDTFEYFSDVILSLAPLRKRVLDIPLLINYYLEKYNNQYHKNIKLSPEILELLANYSWPQNTLQLENVIECLVLGNLGNISFTDLPLEIALKTTAKSKINLITEFEKEYTNTIFEKSGKDPKKAAAFLGIPVSKLS